MLKSIILKYGAFIIFLTVRILSVFIVQTSYVPDEYWQSLEVAHYLAFDYGYLTWEWTLGLRSYVYPLIIATLYKILEFLNLDTPTFLVLLPRIFQASLSAFSDFRFYKWSGETKWAIFTITSSWFWFYTASRNIINTFECSLTVISLSYFPWVKKRKGKKEKVTFIWLAVFICCIRPTAVIVWLPLFIYHMVNYENILKLIFHIYVPIGVIVSVVTVFVDSFMYGSFVYTTFEFFKFNILQNIGEWYGTQPWYWYLSTGLPAILGIHIIPFSLATLVIIKNRQIHCDELALLGTVIFAVAIYSFLPHKEFRFLLPLLPILLYISTRYLTVWSRKANVSKLWVVTAIIFVANIVPAWYFSIIHQRGTIDVMIPLRKIAHEHLQTTNFLFLMPCHSTPLYSYLHKNVTTRFLKCTPNLNNTYGYKDEADQFYENPSKWLRENYPPNGTLPSHIICFDVLLPYLNDILSRYKEVVRFFHASISGNRVGQYVIINELRNFDLLS